MNTTKARGLAKLGIAIAVMSVMSCDREAITLKHDGPKRIIVQEEKELLLSIAPPNDITLRADTDDPMQTISQLRLLFYSTDASPKVEAIREVTISNPSALASISVKLPPKAYKLVVLANPTAELISRSQIGTPLTNFTEGMSLPTSKWLTTLESGAVSHVAMLNAQGVIEVTEEQFEPGGAPLNIDIEPALARVFVLGEPTLRGGRKGSASPRYIITGIQSQVYPLRQMAKLQGGLQNEIAGDNSTRSDRYAVTPMWATWGTTTPSSGSGVSHHTAEGYAQDDYWGLVVTSRDGANTGHRSAYAKESTLPATAYLQGLAPCVVVAYPYVPAELPAGDDSWLSYKGQVYTKAQVQEWLNNPSSSDEVAVALRTAGVKIGDLDKGFQKGELSYYHQGINYYTAYIRHFSGATEANAYGRFGLVRSNEYQMKLTRIEGMGSPIPPTLSDNLNPIVEQRASALSVKLASVSNRTQDVVL